MGEKRIQIYEVGPRDWRFSHGFDIPTESMVEAINELTEAGIKKVEVGASVNYEKFPYMKNSFEILANLPRKPGVIYSIYTGPNERHYPGRVIEQLGLKCDLPEEICVSVSASERRNHEVYHLPGDQIIRNIKKIAQLARRDGVRVRGYISATFGYKSRGDVSIGAAIGLCKILQDLGCCQISLGDTRGRAYPIPFQKKWEILKDHLPIKNTALHFHVDDYVVWESDIAQAIKSGVSEFDTSIMDAPEPKKGHRKDLEPVDSEIPPNVSTEKMIYFINQLNDFPHETKKEMGAESFTTQVDLEKISRIRIKLRRLIEGLAKRTI